MAIMFISTCAPETSTIDYDAIVQEANDFITSNFPDYKGATRWLARDDYIKRHIKKNGRYWTRMRRFKKHKFAHLFRIYVHADLVELVDKPDKSKLIEESDSYYVLKL